MSQKNDLATPNKKKTKSTKVSAQSTQTNEESNGDDAAAKQAEVEKKARKEAHKRRKLQKALRLDDKMFRRVLNVLDIGVAFHDLVTDDNGDASDYQVREVNPAFEDLVGLTVDEIAGKRASEIYGRGRKPVAPFLDHISQALSTEEIVSFDDSLRTTRAKLRFSVIPMGGKLFALMIDDISDAMRTESRARARRTFLENKVKTLSQDIKDLNAKLDDAKSGNNLCQKQVRDMTASRSALDKQLKATQAAVSQAHELFAKGQEQLVKGLPLD